MEALYLDPAFNPYVEKAVNITFKDRFAPASLSEEYSEAIADFLSGTDDEKIAELIPEARRQPLIDKLTELRAIPNFDEANLYKDPTFAPVVEEAIRRHLS